MQAPPFPVCAITLIISLGTVCCSEIKRSSFLLRGGLVFHESVLAVTFFGRSFFSFSFSVVLQLCVCNTWEPLYRFPVCLEIPYSWLFLVAASPCALFTFVETLWIRVAWVVEWPPRWIACALSANCIVTWNLVQQICHSVLQTHVSCRLLSSVEADIQTFWDGHLTNCWDKQRSRYCYPSIIFPSH